MSLNIVSWALHLSYPNASSNPHFSSNHTVTSSTVYFVWEMSSLTAFGSSEMISCTLYPVARYFVETGEWFKCLVQHAAGEWAVHSGIQSEL